MIDVHVVTAANRHNYASVMDDYHRCRYDVFYKERGWQALRCRDSMEFDDYDDDETVYLIAMEGGKVAGGQRLYPTLRPHLLSEVFAYLLDVPLLQNADTWECTRYFVARNFRGRRVEARLIIGLQQFCLEEGISGITGVMEMANIPPRLQAGLRIKPLGLPHDIDGHPTIAVLVEITRDGFEESIGRLGARSLPLFRQGIGVGTIGQRTYEIAA